MFTRRELATLMAATLFWSEEITPHAPRVAEPYFRSVGLEPVKPLSADEIATLLQQLRELHAAADA